MPIIIIQEQLVHSKLLYILTVAFV